MLDKEQVEALVERWRACEPGFWEPDLRENDKGPLEWWTVCNDEEIVAYFVNESDAWAYLWQKLFQIWEYRGGPDLVLAFPGGAGTANMVSQARKAGVAVKEIL